jgi:hypothetical protein
MEFVEMGVYLFSTLLQHPASPLWQYLANGIVRRACFGLSIGATMAALFLTPWGMLLGAELFLWARAGVGPYCAKLHHANDKRCIFCHDTGTTEPKQTNLQTEEIHT